MPDLARLAGAAASRAALRAPADAGFILTLSCHGLYASQASMAEMICTKPG